jgi:glutathione peroxidase-family protein
MKFVQTCLVTGLVIGIPCAGFAQQSKGSPSDIKYCDALSKAYSSLFPAMEAMPASDAVTMNRCDTDTRVSIATLEEKLRGKKI